MKGNMACHYLFLFTLFFLALASSVQSAEEEETIALPGHKYFIRLTNNLSGSAVLHFACRSTEDVITRDLAPNAQFEFEFRYNPVATDWNCYMGYNITQGQLRAGGFHAWSSGNVPKYGGVHAIWSIRDSGFWLFHIKSGQYTLENSWRTSVAVSPV
ncbi:hypothetical protein ACLB2K_001412 [Fragaria x ananassa]